MASNRQSEPASIVFAKGTDVGRVRDHNEDYVDAFRPPDLAQRAEKGVLFIVADGMGGHQAGDVASRTAVEIVSREYYADPDTDLRASLVRAIKKANEVIHGEAQRTPGRAGMGTTIVAAVVRGNDLLLANVGDSRGYLMRQGRVVQATRDHSFVADQVRAGLLTAEEARAHPQRNVITRALGSRPDVKVDAYGGELQPGDTLLLCSDGLSEYVREDDMLAAMEGVSPGDAVSRLIALARERGGSDNITALIVRAEAQPNAAAKTPMHRADREETGRSPPRRLFPWLAASVAALGLVGIAILAMAFVVLPRLRSAGRASPAEGPVPSEPAAATAGATSLAAGTQPPADSPPAGSGGLGFGLESPSDGAVIEAGMVVFRWEWGGAVPEEVVEFVVNSDQGELCRARGNRTSCEGTVRDVGDLEWWVEYQAGGFKTHESPHRRLVIESGATGTFTPSSTLAPDPAAPITLTSSAAPGTPTADGAFTGDG